MSNRLEYSSNPAERPLVRIIWRATTAEYRVSLDGAGEAAAYYTTDHQDAAGTAEAMRRAAGAERVVISANARQQMRYAGQLAAGYDAV